MKGSSVSRRRGERERERKKLERERERKLTGRVPSGIQEAAREGRGRGSAQWGTVPEVCEFELKQ